MKNMMYYNGYYAQIEYSDEDHCFFGTIVGLTDVISFEGQNVQELQKAFAEAVDDYLETCRRIGKDPKKTYKGSFNVRIRPELHQKASLLAQSQGVSLNQLIADAIERYIR